ncbi:hypothetical protein SAMN05443575_0223 [Jatrophihabitans endophyticus]|uniref:Uncharacterized protein n=1 Tax=Jatrophihabitans endophyticus TaxID=1206085 RepID=A0A1M5CG48_9ACTN|nr:hypothetical protein [Jatrophihabitans endophyticus]SHF53392.1 hypothetical protein SAMN05443575_0223 [Jatrophihabitans endophyticus]
MDEERARRVRPRWPVLTRTTLQLMPTLLPDVSSDPATLPRIRSQRHLDLVERTSGATDWSSRALHACLDHLLVSTVTEASRVWVVDAWPDHDDALCIVYRPPHDEGRVVGLRRRRRDAVEPSDWRIGDMTTWGYDMDPDVDPVRFGWNVADFDVGEPLGYVTTVLRYDVADIGWWGNLDDELPRPPAGR